MAFDTVRPLDVWASSAISVKYLDEYLKKAKENSESSPNAHRHRKTKFLTASWEVDTASGLWVHEDLQNLGNLLRRSYGCEWKQHAMNSNDPNPEQKMSDFLKKELDTMEECDLAIVYYVGYGAPLTAGLYKYLYNTPTQAPHRHVDFQKIRRAVIDPAKPSVLMLLDSDHPGVDRGSSRNVDDAGETTSSSRKELISASFSPMPYDFFGGPQSFTSNLTQVLKQAADAGQALTVPRLYAKLAERHLVQGRNYRGQSVTQLETMPVFVRESRERERPIPPIQLTPLLLKPCLPQLLVIEEPVSVILRVRLEDTEQALSQLHRSSLCPCPDPSRRFLYCSVHRIGGTMNIGLQMPLDLWAGLPSEPAVKFVAFEDNRIAERYRNGTNPRMILRSESEPEPKPRSGSGSGPGSRSGLGSQPEPKPQSLSDPRQQAPPRNPNGTVSNGRPTEKEKNCWNGRGRGRGRGRP